MARRLVTLIQCDRCGRQKCEGKGWYSLYYQVPEDSSEHPDFDLCPQCTKDFSIFMNENPKKE